MHTNTNNMLNSSTHTHTLIKIDLYHFPSSLSALHPSKYPRNAPPALVVQCKSVSATPENHKEWDKLHSNAVDNFNLASMYFYTLKALTYGRFLAFSKI